MNMTPVTKERFKCSYASTTLEHAFHFALKDNFNYDDGKPNWNFIDSDCYAESADNFVDDDEFYKEFDALCARYVQVSNGSIIADKGQPAYMMTC